MLKAFHKGQLEGVTYLKLAKIDGSSPTCNRDNLLKLLRHIKLKSVNSFSNYYLIYRICRHKIKVSKETKTT